MSGNTTNKKKQTSMLLLLLLSIGGTIATFNFLQTVIVARTARLDIVEDAAEKFAETASAYALAMDNDLWG